jgi:uncharacterized protein YdaT
MDRKNVHVTQHQDGWQVRREGAERASSVHETQHDAVERAREIARDERGEVFIHGEDGKIRDRDSYGNDPNPPKDRRH